MGEVITLIAMTVSSVTGAAVFTKLTVTLLLSTVVNKLFGPKIPNMKHNLRAHAITKRSTMEYRSVVYGKAAISGPVVYNNVSGTDREHLWTAIALHHGEIESLESVWFDNDEIPASDISWSPSISGGQGSGTGDVATAKWLGDDSTTAVRIFWTLGHEDQLAMSQLTSEFADFGSNHRGRGVALLVTKLTYVPKTEKVWQSGQPRNTFAVVKGRKLYDPRLDSTRVIDDSTSPLTYGSGAHRIADDSTWVWSDNPALCVADYLYSIMGVADGSIDWQSIADAADDCDVSVVIDTASPEGTETRFTCNGVVTLGSSHNDNLGALLSSLDGKLTYSAGLWKLRASVWEASTVSYGEDDLAGDIEVRGSAPKSERFNTVRGMFVDPDRNYKPHEFPIVTNSDYVVRDGSNTIYRDLSLPMTNSATMAQRIGFRLIEQGDNQIVMRARMNHRGASCTVGDVVTWDLPDLGWDADSSPITSKTFRVIEWMPAEGGGYDVTFREDYSASYDDPAGADYTDGNSGTITIPSEVVPPPTGLSASAVPYGIRLNWTNPATNEFDYIDVYVSTDSSWSNATRAGSVRTDTYRYDLAVGGVRYFWIRARRNNGDVSTRLPDSDTSTVSGTAGGTTDSVSLTGATLTDTQIMATAEVGYRLTSGGLEESREGTPDSPPNWDTIDTWLIEGNAADYYVELTQTSGTAPTSGPALATRQVLSSTREWVWSDTVAGDGVTSFVGTVEIWDNSSPHQLFASATLTVSIEQQDATVTLSGQQVTGFNSGATAEAGIQINDDGNVYERTNLGSWSQIDTVNDWVRPTTESPGNYQVRWTNATGDTGDMVNTTAEDVWHPMSSGDWIISLRDTASGGPMLEVVCTIEIGQGSPITVDASNTYTLRALRTDL